MGNLNEKCASEVTSINQYHLKAFKITQIIADPFADLFEDVRNVLWVPFDVIPYLHSKYYFVYNYLSLKGQAWFESSCLGEFPNMGKKSEPEIFLQRTRRRYLGERKLLVTTQYFMKEIS